MTPARDAARAADRHLRALELPVVEAAAALVGCTITHGECSGVIVETEAYHETEPACHAFVGLTPRTRPLFEAPGIAYVYRSYGIHALLNVVVEPAGVGAAVLIRALEPLAGLRAHARAPRPRARRPTSARARASSRRRSASASSSTRRRCSAARSRSARRRPDARRAARSSPGRGSGSRARSSCRGASAPPATATSRGRGRRGLLRP